MAGHPQALTWTLSQARDLITRSSGAERTATLAAEHAATAREALQGLPESESRQALEDLTFKVLDRKK